MTVRPDLDVLGHDGDVRRVRGGAVRARLRELTAPFGAAGLRVDRA